MLVSEEPRIGPERSHRVRQAWWMLAAALAVRLAAALASGALQSPLNNYADYAVTSSGHLILVNPGLFPPGEFYAAWILFTAGFRTTAGFGFMFVVLGALVPPLIVRLSPQLFPAMTRQQASLAGWLAVFFPPLVLLSATWRYMLPPVLLGLWALDAVTRRRTVDILLSSTALLLTRPDYWVGALVALFLFDARRIRTSVLAAVPVLILIVHNVVAPAAFRGPHNLWYNLDAGTNADTRIAVIGYGPRQWGPEGTLGDASHDENDHRRHVIAFVRSRPAALLELLVMKTARVFDVRRDGALLKAPLENAVYTATMLALLATAVLGIGQMGIRAGRPGLLVLLAYMVPMIAIFSLDRTRVLFQSLWLMPAAFWLHGVLPSRVRRGWLYEA